MQGSEGERECEWLEGMARAPGGGVLGLPRRGGVSAPRITAVVKMCLHAACVHSARASLGRVCSRSH
jgi:hypothetical protein